MSRVVFIVFLSLLGGLGCGHRLTASDRATASGGPPKNSASPSAGCIGDAPIDEEIRQVPGVRASWFNAPDGSKRLYVLEAGPRSEKRPSLVLIHGVGAIGTGDFHPVLAGLSRTRHVLMVDLPGFGRSNMNSEDLGPEVLLQSVDAVSRACASKKFDVLGHSTGGALALLFAAQRADAVRRLVIVDAAGILRPDALLRGQLHSELTEMRADAPAKAKMVEKLGDFLIAALNLFTTSAVAVADSGLVGRSPQVLAAAGLLDYDLGEAIHAIRAPTLILWGKEDHVVPARIARLLEDRIEHAEVQFIEGAGHVPMKDTPQLFASMVSDYLASKTPAKKPPKPPNTSTREGRCERQENLILEGDYARVDVNRCKKVWLNRVRAKQIVIKDSEGRIDNTEVSEGITIENSEFALTGGALHGEVALDASESKLDVAGVEIAGDVLAVRVRQRSSIVFSVTPLKSPKNDHIFHGSVEYEAGSEL